MKPMLRSTLVAALGILTSGGIALAQSHISIGPVAGVNVANVSVDPSFSTFFPGATSSARTGFLAGAALEYGGDFPLLFQPEVQYVQKGVVVDYPNHRGLGPATGTFTFDYIEFPILAKLKLGDRALSGYLVAGPNIGMNLSATGNFHYTTPGEASDYSQDFSDGVQRVDIAIDLGGGVSYEIQPGVSLVGDLRYSHGIYDVTPPIRDGDETWYSRDFKGKIGLMFDIWHSK